MTARRRRLVTGIVLAGAVLAALGLNPAGAADPSLQDRIDSASSDAGQLSDRIDAQEARRAGAEAMVLNAQVEDAEARSRELATRLTAAERSLDRARAEYDEAVKALEQRLIDIYKSDMPGYVDVLLNADGFDDLSTRSDYLEALNDADKRIAERVASLRDQVAGQVHEIADLKRETEAQAARLDATRASFEATEADARQGIATVATARSESQSDLSVVQEQVSDLAAELAEQAEQAEQQAGSPAYEGGPYAIPTYIVMCESGGNYQALNPSSGAGGAYQILPSTWRAYGGQGLPHQAPKAEQDRIAAEIWADSGPSAWSCA
jgi:peptidoglycan hydrolase CwlO-like protein